jgi:hypothetical protein
VGQQRIANFAVLLEMQCLLTPVPGMSEKVSANDQEKWKTKINQQLQPDRGQGIVG